MESLDCLKKHAEAARHIEEKSFGNLLSKVRQECSMSIKEIAEILNLETEKYKSIENGQSVMKTENLHTLAKIILAINFDVHKLDKIVKKENSNLRKKPENGNRGVICENARDASFWPSENSLINQSIREFYVNLSKAIMKLES